jgi:hypothetical protein
MKPLKRLYQQEDLKLLHELLRADVITVAHC